METKIEKNPGSNLPKLQTSISKWKGNSFVSHDKKKSEICPLKVKHFDAELYSWFPHGNICLILPFSYRNVHLLYYSLVSFR